MTQISQKLIEFADKYLASDIDNLSTFPLTRTKGGKFGCPGRTFDPDDTEIMRYIYVALFRDAFPELSLETLANGIFRGDTLNTYNTMFGRPDDSSLHPGLDRFAPPEDLKAKVADFYLNHFPTIGNMVVLPNLRVQKKSLNTYRGCHPQWRDYFDRFLPEVRKVMTCHSNYDETLHQIMDANHAYLNRYYGEEGRGFDNFVQSLFLTDYLAASYHSKGFYFWKKDLPRDAYLEEAVRYIDFSNKVIENRGKRMIKKVKEFLETWSYP